MTDLFDNPMGLLEPVFKRMDFTLVVKHRSRDVVLCRQGQINFIINRQLKSVAAYVAADAGPSVCGMAFQVQDAHHACNRALALGAQPVDIPTAPIALRLPAIKGTGGAPLYVSDRFEDGKSIFDIDFVIFPSRILVARQTFRPPWFYRNLASKFMGLVPGAYDAKAEGVKPGGAGLYNCMTAHSPDAATFAKTSQAHIAQPHAITDAMVSMLETRCEPRPTAQPLACPSLQANYQQS